MGALNRLKFCTYVARQQRNRSQSPLPPPPPPPTPLTHSPLSSSLLGLLRRYHWKWLINFYKKSINGADYELRRVKKQILATQKCTPAQRPTSAFISPSMLGLYPAMKVWTPLIIIKIIIIVIIIMIREYWWYWKSLTQIFFLIPWFTNLIVIMKFKFLNASLSTKKNAQIKLKYGNTYSWLFHVYRYESYIPNFPPKNGSNWKWFYNNHIQRINIRTRSLKYTSKVFLIVFENNHTTEKRIHIEKKCLDNYLIWLVVLWVCSQ